MRTPKVSQPKELPNDQEAVVVLPKETEKKKEEPIETKKIEATPVESNLINETPEESSFKEELPSDLVEKNCVLINGKQIEIKPTKLKYFRNKAASGYKIIKMIPLHELLTYEKGVLDAERNADQLLYDFLVAVFDDSTFVRDNYDNLDAEIIDNIVQIFGRINHIDEKEELQRKNREAQAKH